MEVVDDAAVRGFPSIVIVFLSAYSFARFANSSALSDPSRAPFSAATTKLPRALPPPRNAAALPT